MTPEEFKYLTIALRNGTLKEFIVVSTATRADDPDWIRTTSRAFIVADSSEAFELGLKHLAPGEKITKISERPL